MQRQARCSLDASPSEAPAGRGGRGAVYRAHNASTGRLVALELLHPTSCPEAARRSTREAELLPGLRPSRHGGPRRPWPLRAGLALPGALGRTFWPGGARARLAPAEPAHAPEQRLSRLVEQEWGEPQPSSRSASEAEYRFRHAPARDALHGLVSESHRPMGQRLAGGWRGQSGEHAQLGQQPEPAIHFLTLAAEQHGLHVRLGRLHAPLRSVPRASARGGAGGRHQVQALARPLALAHQRRAGAAPSSSGPSPLP